MKKKKVKKNASLDSSHPAGDQNDGVESKKQDRKVVEKTVNRTGKKISEDKLVMKDKKTKEKEKREEIKKRNEEILRRAQDDVVKSGKKKNDDDLSSKKQDKKKTKEEKYELSVGMEDLFKAGCHLGHGKSKTHPKARENIYGVRNNVEVFDLAKTVKSLEIACTYIHNLIQRGDKLIMVGTKRQAREVVRRVAMEVSVPYVTDRWLGGTITNWDQIKKNIEKLGFLKESADTEKFSDKTKKERSVIRKEVARLERIVGGLIGLNDLPKAIFVVDVGAEKTAVKEAKIKGIKVIGICDSNVNPDEADMAIPANDDNVKSISIIVEEIGKAIKK